MLRPPVTVSVAFDNGMLSGWVARGRSCEPLLLEAGITPELLQQPGARVSADQYVLLFKLLIERFDDECLGFLPRRSKSGSFALITVRAISSRTLEAAIRRIVHVFFLLHDDIALELLRDGELCGLALRFADRSASYPPFLHELLLRVYWRLLGLAVGWALARGALRVRVRASAVLRQLRKGFFLRYFASTAANPRFGSMPNCYRDRCVATQPPCGNSWLKRRRKSSCRDRRDDLFSSRARSHLQQMQPAWPGPWGDG